MVECGIGINAEEHLDKLPVKLLNEFDFVEFPGVWLDSVSACRKLASLRKWGCELQIRHLVPPALVQIVPQENWKVKTEFDRNFRERCQQAVELDVREVEIDFDLEQAVFDPIFRKALQKLMLSCCGALQEFKLNMRLNCRLPRPPGGSKISELLDFRRELGLPGTGFNLDFFPYEPGAFELLEEERNALRFIRNYWRIHFEPEHGNLLNATVWKKILQQTESEFPAADRQITLVPGSAMPDEELLTYLIKLLREAGSL